MKIVDACFLSIDEGLPLSLYLSNSYGIQIIKLDDFLKESKIDMSKRMAKEYANRLSVFIRELNEYADS